MKEIYYINCQKCRIRLPESELQLSHDVPKYIGGNDKDGRHYLCKKCHDIYEKAVFSAMTLWLSKTIRNKCKEKAKRFALIFFGEKNDI